MTDGSIFWDLFPFLGGQGVSDRLMLSRLFWMEGAPPIRLHRLQEDLGVWELILALTPPFILILLLCRTENCTE